MTEFRGPVGSDGPDESLVGLWALINAAQHRLLVLAIAQDDGALLSEAAMVLRLALAELELRGARPSDRLPQSRR
jgi:hypothetical protein